MKTCLSIKCCLLVLLLLTIAGCSGFNAVQKDKMLATTVRQSLDEMTPIPSIGRLTKTPVASRNPTLSPTNTPTHTPQPPTATPRPTLSPKQSKELILELVQEHKGCQLPCLWGLTPEQTDVETARMFADQFGTILTTDIEIVRDDFDDMRGVGLTYKSSDVFITVDLSYYQSKVDTLLALLTMYSFSLNQVGVDPITKEPALAPVWGDPTFNQELRDYLLPSILSSYGQPSQVLLATWSDDPNRTDIKWVPFSIVLFYPEQGIFVEYVSPRETAGSNFVFCPSKSHIKLGVWSPDSDLSFDYIVGNAGLVINELNIDYFQSVEEATSMTLEEFYQKFRDPSNTACLKTPKGLWYPY